MQSLKRVNIGGFLNKFLDLGWLINFLKIFMFHKCVFSEYCE